MFKRIHMENFKSWKDTGEVQMAPLTGLFGTNSSGKSSILQMLLMMKQTVESSDRKRVLHTGDNRSLVDLGTFYDLIHGHRSDESLKLSFSWTLPEPLLIKNPETEHGQLYCTTELSFTTEVREEKRRIVVEEFKYEFGGNEFGMQRRADTEKKAQLAYDLIARSMDYRAKRNPGRVWPLPPPVKSYGFPDEASGYYQNTGFLQDFVLELEKVFTRMTYLGPLREYPTRTYVWAGDSPPDVGQRGEHAVAALLASRGQKVISPGRKKRRQTVEERVAYWLKKMDLIHSFALRPIASNRKDYEVRVQKTANSPEVLITDVGFGVSQILPVLVLCYYAPEHSTILLEQPEIHLHPSVQADLADVLIDVIKNRNVQIVVESHSEHLLLRLQRRIAEEMISPDKTALYFCQIDNGSSQITKLNIDLFGNITNWPNRFFGDEVGELAAMTIAAMKRQGEISKEQQMAHKE